MKKILIMYYTHGNEPLGKDVLEYLIRIRPDLTIYYDMILVNKLASDMSIRFVEFDMNRIAPGDMFSHSYEKRRVAEVINVLSNYEYVVDIHETKSSDEIMLIIPDRTYTRLQALDFCPVRKVVLWEPTNQNSKSLILFAKSGFGLEVGTKKTYEKKVIEVANVLSETILNLTNKKKDAIKKVYFSVFGSIQKTDLTDVPLNNFKKYISPNKEIFYPLCFGLFNGKLGYKMEKVNLRIVNNNRIYYEIK